MYKGKLLISLSVVIAALVIGLVITGNNSMSHGIENNARQESSSTKADASASRATIEVVLEDLRFKLVGNPENVQQLNKPGEPLKIKIDPGTTIVFENKDSFEHNVMHATPENLEAIHGKSAFHSPEYMKPGEKFAYTFEKEGTYPILCMVGGHYKAGMVATIIVGDNPPSATETFAMFTGHSSSTH